MTKATVCKDCRAEWEVAHDEWVRIHPHVFVDPGEPKLPSRPAPEPGPRCATHWRKEQKRRKAANHDKKVQNTYGLASGDYRRLLEFQGGTCAICGRAKGISKRLAVDHDHDTGAPRGLLCSLCNSMLGHGRDEVAFFEKVIEYLIEPPYRLYLKEGGTWPPLRSPE